MDSDLSEEVAVKVGMHKASALTHFPCTKIEKKKSLQQLQL